MIGIVIVSHSMLLVKGVLEMAREMAGPDVPIAIAGGFGGPGSGLGTDVASVLHAIEQVYSDEGVLVLMDMGSAILNSEMALEMLPPEKRANVLLCSAPIAEGAVAAATCARLGRTLPEIAREAGNALAVKMSHLADTADLPPDLSAAAMREENQRCIDGMDLQIRVPVNNRHGLHARPAARLIKTAAGYQAEVFVWNVNTNRGPVNTRSLNDLMMLGVLKGHELQISARGPQAREALDALKLLVKDNFGDDEAEEEKANEKVEAFPGRDCASATLLNKFLRGVAVSPGIAIGPVRFLSAQVPSISSENASDPGAEWNKLVGAWEMTERRIEEQSMRVARRGDARAMELFDAHLLLARDDSLRMATRRKIFDHGQNAAWAWHLTVEEAVAQYRSLGDKYLAARARDLSEVGRQVLVNLLGTGTVPAELGKACILAGEDIGLSDIAAVDPKMVLGICTARNGLTAHGVILARNLGIPAVTGLGEQMLGIGTDTTMIVDGDDGSVCIDPDQVLLDDYRARLTALQVSREKARRENLLPALTVDGRRIEVHANIGSPAEAEAAVANGSEGVGLYRTEFLFLSREAAPDEEEQYAVYLEAARALGGRPFVIRTLDSGGDKTLPYLRLTEEQNPFLGLRGLRLSLKHRDLFMVQLRAIVRVASAFPVKVMFPMVSTVSEWHEAAELLSRARAAVADRGLPTPASIEAGIMVEVPAAALLAGQFAPLVDFFSIGSNDLAQYTLASERGNPEVQHIYDSLHPAVLRLMHHVVEAAHSCGKRVSICGEIAGEDTAAPLLAGLGIDSLSMNYHQALSVKRKIRESDLRIWEDMAKTAMGLETAGDVRALLERVSVEVL